VQALLAANARLLADQRRAIVQRLAREAARLNALGRALNAVSPLATLERGYALVLDADGRSVRSAAALVADEVVRLRLADGERALRVLGVDPDAPPGVDPSGF